MSPREFAEDELTAQLVFNIVVRMPRKAQEAWYRALCASVANGGMPPGDERRRKSRRAVPAGWRVLAGPQEGR